MNLFSLTFKDKIIEKQYHYFKIDQLIAFYLKISCLIIFSTIILTVYQIIQNEKTEFEDFIYHILLIIIYALYIIVMKTLPHLFDYYHFLITTIVSYIIHFGVNFGVFSDEDSGQNQEDQYIRVDIGKEGGNFSSGYMIAVFVLVMADGTNLMIQLSHIVVNFCFFILFLNENQGDGQLIIKFVTLFFALSVRCYYKLYQEKLNYTQQARGTLKARLQDEIMKNNKQLLALGFNFNKNSEELKLLFSSAKAQDKFDISENISLEYFLKNSFISIEVPQESQRSLKKSYPTITINNQPHSSQQHSNSKLHEISLYEKIVASKLPMKKEQKKLCLLYNRFIQSQQFEQENQIISFFLKNQTYKIKFFKEGQKVPRNLLISLFSYVLEDGIINCQLYIQEVDNLATRRKTSLQQYQQKLHSSSHSTMTHSQVPRHRNTLQIINPIPINTNNSKEIDPQILTQLKQYHNSLNKLEVSNNNIQKSEFNKGMSSSAQSSQGSHFNSGMVHSLLSYSNNQIGIQYQKMCNDIQMSRSYMSKPALKAQIKEEIQQAYQKLKVIENLSSQSQYSQISSHNNHINININNVHKNSMNSSNFHSQRIIKGENLQSIDSGPSSSSSNSSCNENESHIRSNIPSKTSPMRKPVHSENFNIENGQELEGSIKNQFERNLNQIATNAIKCKE